MRNKVLVIEDHRDLYSLFDCILQFHGFQVTVVSDGTKAMELLKDGTPFDAITLDLHLPGTPGTEIFDMLEKRGRGTVMATERQQAALSAHCRTSQKQATITSTVIAILHEW